MIMQDDWFGHRDPLTGAKLGDRHEWILWDFSLMNAYKLIEDYTDERGILLWEKDMPGEPVIFDTELKLDRATEAVVKAESAHRERMANNPGMYVVVKPKLRAKDWPTHIDYFKWLAEKNNEE